jgi:arginine decarboxylase
VVLAEARERVRSGRAPVSATFVTPYPPGFPLLVPGQVIDEPTLAYLEALDTPEVHGYRAEEGLRVFREEALRAEPAAGAENAVAQRRAPIGVARRAPGGGDAMSQPNDTTGGEIP